MCGGTDKVKLLIVTVAGSSARFSKSLGKEVLKCIYYQNDFSESLLYRMLHQPVEFDKYIIVGGYKFEELKNVVKNKFQEFKDKIVLIKNDFFMKYGSGYSLYCGINEALNYQFDEIVFAEGDLFVDMESFVKISNTANNVITCNSDPILANKAVAFYFDEKNIVHYIYDTGHSTLVIQEPFLSIYNSGQIWKFANESLIRKVYANMSEKEWQGTNLVMIENYFKQVNVENYEMIRCKNWINCNTIEDFEKIEKVGYDR